jgi:branched-chain amino acid transport system permease protein
MMIVLLGLMGAFAAAPAIADTTGEEYDFRIAGNVKNEGEPIADVRIEVANDSYSAEIVTDAEGKWAIGVPEGGIYSVTLDESTLPEGIAVLEGGATQSVEIGPSGSVVKNFFIGEGERQVVTLVDQIVQRLIYGINFGLMLGLASIGLSLVYGTTGLSNFSHAELVTFGALMALAFGVVLALPLWIAFPLALVASAGLGWAQDAGLWRPLRKRGLGLVQLMIVSIGLSLAVRYVFQFFVGGGTTQLPGSGGDKIPLFGAVALSVVDLSSMTISLVVIVLFALAPSLTTPRLRLPRESMLTAWCGSSGFWPQYSPVSLESSGPTSDLESSGTWERRFFFSCLPPWFLEVWEQPLALSWEPSSWESWSRRPLWSSPRTSSTSVRWCCSSQFCS